MNTRHILFVLLSVLLSTSLLAYLPPTNLHYEVEDDINLRLMWTAPEDIGGTYLLYQGFETNLIETGWSLKRSNDLTGSNLVDVSENTNSWFQVDPTSFNNQGNNLIYSGNHSAGIRYNVSGFHWLITEDVNLTGNNVLKFQLWYKNAPEYNWITMFHVMVYNNQQWTVLQTYDSNSPNNMFDSMEELSLTGITGATKLAFVYEGGNGFQLAVDDIAIIEPSTTINSRSADAYKIYRDDSLYTEVSSSDTMYFIEAHPLGNFNYYVTAVYGPEESLPSNNLDVQISNNALLKPVPYLTGEAEDAEQIVLAWMNPDYEETVMWGLDFEYPAGSFPPQDLAIYLSDDPEGYVSTMTRYQNATDLTWNLTNTNPLEGENSLYISPGSEREFFFLITEADERDYHQVLNFDLIYNCSEEMTTELMIKAIVDDNDWKDLMIMNSMLFNNNNEYRVSVPLEKADGDNAGIAFIYNKLSHSQVIIDNVTITRPGITIPTRGMSKGFRDAIPLTGYNIYMKTTELDTLIATVPDSVTSYTIPRSSLSQYSNALFFVAADYSGLESRRSNFFNTYIFDTPEIDNAIEKPELEITNYPNPFNPETTISYSISTDSNVAITIYNVKGQKVKTLIENYQIKGKHNVVWNGIDGSGYPVSSGVYFCRIKTENDSQIKKMLLIK